MALDDLKLSDLKKILINGDPVEIASLIRSYKTQWNELVKSIRQADEKIKLSGLDLSGEDLSGLDLEGTIIEDSDLSGSDLSDSILDDSTLVNTDLSGAYLTGASLYRSRMSQTDLSDARIYGARGLDNAYLTGSVNIFSTYSGPEDKYRTSPEITYDGFRKAEAYEERMEHSDDEDEEGY